MRTRDEYLKKAKDELGEREYSAMSWSLDNEYYALVESHVKQGNVIRKEVYNSLSEGQRFHFNKHYNYRGNMVLN